MIFNSALKRLFDILFSLFCLILSMPLWMVIVLLIYFDDGSPVFYSDIRAGRDNLPYKHYKFRSMKKNAESFTGPVWSRQNDNRLTKTGTILRATAMDELPQLINILKGDMSFVGPRPERVFFVEKFSKEIPGYEDRLAVRPGLTGMAQVWGKYNTPPQEKLRLDLEYIRKNNIFLDMGLIFKSFLITFRSGWARFEE